MNAIVRTPDAPADLEQDALDRMARNRAQPARRMGSLARPATVPGPPPEAFREAVMAKAVQDARDALARADCDMRTTVGKVFRERTRRVKMRCQRALADAEKSLQAEVRGEALADAVLRQDQVEIGQNGIPISLREARVVVRDGKRAEVVTALDWLLSRKSIDGIAHAGGVRYRTAYEAAHLDMYPIGLGGDEAGSKGVPSSGNRRIEHAVAQSRDLDAMRSLLAPDALAVVEAVVIEGRDVRGWAASRVTGKRTGTDPAIAMGTLKTALGVFGRMR